MGKLSLKQLAYNSIKEKILKCEYMPNSFLNEDLLCEEFKVSRTPIRDALSRLEQEHLIKILPKKGFFVAPLSIGEINLTFETRTLLESYAICNHCANLNSDTMDLLYENIKNAKECIKNNDQEGLFRLDDEFHRILLNQCNNYYLIDTYSRVHNQNCRLRVLSGLHDDNRIYSTVDEHMEILSFLAKGDLDAAVKAMTSHLDNAKNASFQAFLDGNSLL